MGVGAVVVDTVDVIVVELRPVPSDNRRTSLPVSAQPTTRSRSPCVSNMSCTGAPAKGRRTRGGRRTKGNRATPCASHSCTETHMPRNDCATDNCGSVGSTVKCSGAGVGSACRFALLLSLLSSILLEDERGGDMPAKGKLGLSACRCGLQGAGCLQCLRVQITRTAVAAAGAGGGGGGGP